MNYFYIYLSPYGKILLISDGENLVEMKIDYRKNIQLVESNSLEIFQKTCKWLDLYFEGKKPNIKIPLKLEGTEFQKDVWNLLLQIPYGQVITYGEIAKRMMEKRKNQKIYAQAIGSALNKNPIPIIVPCHRVIGKNKNLVGYRLGIDRKINLLELEHLNLENYYFYENQKKKYIKKVS